jgi:hypothetical protein
MAGGRRFSKKCMGPLSALRSKLAKEAAVISPHPLLDETTFIVKPKDI